jgi:hypothetical protein
VHPAAAPGRDLDFMQLQMQVLTVLGTCHISGHIETQFAARHAFTT